MTELVLQRDKAARLGSSCHARSPLLWGRGATTIGMAAIVAVQQPYIQYFDQ